MYLLQIHFANAYENGDGRLLMPRRGNAVPKWTFLSAEESNREMLRLVALGCGGTEILPRIPFAWQSLRRDRGIPLHVEIVVALYPPYETSAKTICIWGSGVRMKGGRVFEGVRGNEYRFLHSDVAKGKMKTGVGASHLFFLGYGPSWVRHHGTDDFDYADPFHRRSRVHSRFYHRAAQTDPDVRFDWLLYVDGLMRSGVAKKDPPPECRPTLHLYLGDNIGLDEILVPLEVEVKSGGELEDFLSEHTAKRSMFPKESK
jgi:hypothetical protein